MDNDALRKRALYLAEVEKLSGKQIQSSLGIGYRKLKCLILNGKINSIANGVLFSIAK